MLNIVTCGPLLPNCRRGNTAAAAGAAAAVCVSIDGAAASAQTIADGKADLAIIRGDLNVPKNAQAVATLRKNVAVLWVPPAVKGKKAGPKITKIAQLSGRRVGVVGRTQAIQQ